MRWPLGGRRRGRPVLPSRHPAPPAVPPSAPPTQTLPPPASAPANPAPRAAQPPSPPPAVPRQPVAPPPPPPDPRPAAPQQQPPAPPASGTPAGALKPPDDGARPATVDDLRSLRRWLAVAAIWAVAATAIAVLAYLEANNNDDDQQIADTSRQARSIQRRLDRQVDQLQARIAAVPSAQTVSDVAKRNSQLGRIASRQDKQLHSLGVQLKNVRASIADLQDQVEANTQDETTTTP
jgi:hypothetical protein